MDRFCVIKSCGCVISQKVPKEIPSSTCLACGKPFTEDDVIILNGTYYNLLFADATSPEERKVLRERMEARRAKKSVCFLSFGSRL